MSKLKAAAEIIIATSKTLANDEGVQKMLMGTYSDGSPRSVPDMINGEYLSPKQKKKAIKKKKKKKQVKFKL